MTAPAATAASAPDPPASRMATPATAASWSAAATMPRAAVRGGNGARAKGTRLTLARPLEQAGEALEVRVEALADLPGLEAEVVEGELVHAVGTRRMGPGPGLDGGTPVPELEPEPLVGAGQRLDGPGPEVLEGDVGEEGLAGALAEVEGSADGLGPEGELVAAELLGVVAVRHPAAGVGDEAADRAQDGGGVAVGPEEPGRGVGGHQRVVGEHVHRCLQVPQARRAVPLEELEYAPVHRVRAVHVAVDDPFDVARHPGHAVEVLGAELHSEQVLALRRPGGRLEVEGAHPGERLVHELEAGGGRLDARVVVLVGRLGRRDRIRRLPE